LGVFFTRFPTALDLATDLSNAVKSPSPTMSSISSKTSSADMFDVERLHWIAKDLKVKTKTKWIKISIA
jgi:hypothetical protein